MKKLIAWILLVILAVGVLAGCGCQAQPDETAPSESVAQGPSQEIQDVIEYLKAIYKDDGAKTPVDFERFGIVRIAGVPYEVVWTADVGEDLIKIVVNDDGTVTIDVNEEAAEDTPYVLTATVTDENGNSVSHSWNYILPQAVDMVAIVDAAYALAPGESLPYESTLRGKIISVDTPWDDDYKNITVTIEITGAEDRPIKCYRLKGEGADELQIGDTITVTGTLKNYNGTIEFDAGCTLDAVVPGERVKAPDDPKQIVDEAYALGANKSLPYEATLTGKITQIKTPYDSAYGNITVEFVVEGREYRPIVCYRLKGSGVDRIGVNDIITVKGYITNYVGDKGYSTIEFVAGCQLIEWEDRASPVQPSDPKQVVDEAYALGANKSLPYEATLTGKITKVGTAYDPGYGNITVTMVIEGRENMPLVCYRMKGSGVDVIDVGDTITVKGYIKNYVGDKGYSTIEFDYPTLLSYKKNSAEAPEDPVEIVKAAYALEPGKQLPYKATLTGKVTEINTPYDAGYDNITVTIVVEGAEDMPIKCYRLKGNNNSKIQVGDVITVTGYIENYQHSSGDAEVEFTAGCQMTDWVPSGEVKPDEPATDITIAEALEMGAAMEHNTYTTEKYNVTGLITEVYNTQYGNMRISDADGNILTIYGTYDATGENRYDAMEVKPVAGDVVTICGVIGQYNGTPQIKNGWIVDHVPGGVLPEEPEVPELPTEDGAEISIADAIAAGKAMEHNTYTELKYKVTGKITEVYNTQYGNMKITDEDGNVLTIYGTYDATGENRYDAMEVKPVAGDTVTIYGMLGQYNGTPQIKNGWIVEHTPAGEAPEEPEEPDTTEVVDIATALAATEGTFTVKGVVTLVDSSNYYVQDATGAICVRLATNTTEIALGDTIIATGTRADYNGMPQLGSATFEKSSGLTLEAKETTIDALTTADICTYVTIKGLTITEVFDSNGQYTSPNVTVQDANGNSIQIYKAAVEKVDGKWAFAVGDVIDFTGAVGVYKETLQLRNTLTSEIVLAGAEPEEPETPDEPSEGENEITIAEALEMGAAMEHNTYTEVKYTVTGVITEVYNTQYGNMKITDEDGNILTIYGTYDATGEIRYDAMEVKPVAGDTVTIYGVVGQYNGTPQIKNGWIMEHVAGEGTPEEPEVPELPTEDGAEISIADAIAAGKAMEHNTYTEVKYTVTGVITEVYNTQYGNMKITGEDGNILTIYGTYDATGEIRYDAMEVKPVAGDTVTIYGMLGQYNGTPQIKNGWIMEHTPAGETPEEPETPELPEGVVEIATALEAEEGTFSVMGVVTLIDDVNYYVQDATGGICVRLAEKTTEIELGDTIIGTGSRAVYNSLPQLGSATFEKATGLELKAKETTIDALTTEDICTYVTIKDLTVTDVNDNGGQYTTPNVGLKDAKGNTIEIYKAVVAKDGDKWAIKVGDVIDVTAAVSCYNKILQLRNTKDTELVLITAAPDAPEADTPAGVASTISFADAANRTAFTTEQQVWAQNGITVTNDKSESTTKVADYSNPVRFYAGSKVTIAANGMTTIVINCNSATYATALVNSIGTISNGTVSVSGSVVTITLTSATNTFVIAKLTAQVRVNSITVYAG